MNPFKSVATALLSIGVFGCASVALPTAEPDSSSAVTQARVLRDGDIWILDYKLDRDSTVWAFPVSAVRRQTRQPWRQSEWIVETGNAVLKREGDYDILTTTDGSPVPRSIRIRMMPVGGSLDREYDPAIIFSNGTAALYSEQFDIAPVASIEAMALTETSDVFETVVVPVSYTDTAGPVLVNGERLVTGTSSTTPTYVVFGPGDSEGGSGANILADPALPTWIRGELLDYLPKVLDGYTQRLGPRLNPDPPTMIASWNGPTKGKVDMSGGVRPGLILLAFEGEGVLDREPRTLARARWFIAHEAAHFWLGSSGVAYEKPGDAWITEGGADLMALRLLADLDPTYDVNGDIERAKTDCVKFGTSPIESAATRNESRAYYACGLVFALMAETLAQHNGGRDVFEFIGPLFAANHGDRIISRDEWLEHLERLSGDPSLGDDILRMLTQGVADPSSHLAVMFDKVGSSKGEASRP